jgi:cytochrome P450
MTVLETVAVRRPPAAPGLPVLGNALEMAGNVQQFFVKQYRKLGPVYRAHALQQEFTIFAGLEANQFLWHQGETYLSNVQTMGSLSDEFSMMVHALKGPRHEHLRKVLGPAIAPEALISQWERYTTLTCDLIDRFPTDRPISVVDFFQRIAAEQLSVLLGNQSSSALFEELRYVFELALDVRLAKKWPMFMLNLPVYQRRKAQINAFVRGIMADHRGKDIDDLVSTALNALDEQGHPYPEAEQVGMILQGYFGAINTVAYLCAFMIYALFQNPALMVPVRDEVREAFADGTPAPQHLRKLRSLHALAQESLRMYDPAPASVRTVAEPFTFNDYIIAAGTPAMFAFSATHYLEEFFPDPYTFRIDRGNYLENQRLGAYRPYSLGAHTCLGAGLADIQAMSTVAILLDRVDMQDVPRRVRIVAAPGLHPDMRFAMTIRPHHEH